MTKHVQPRRLQCIPLKAYLNETGETREAINKRIQRGVWRIGVEVLDVDGCRERWIDCAEVENWARKSKTSLAA
jgi:hypothetical protein